MCARFLIDQLRHTNDNVISVQDRHAAYRVRFVASFIVHFFVESWILMKRRKKESEREREKKQVFCNRFR